MYYSNDERKGIVCNEQPNVDEDCVNQTVSNDMGQHMGSFGLFNNCITYVNDVIRKCTHSPGIQRVSMARTELRLRQEIARSQEGIGGSN
jgi:hypothetical protein